MLCIHCYLLYECLNDNIAWETFEKHIYAVGMCKGVFPTFQLSFKRLWNVNVDIFDKFSSGRQPTLNEEDFWKRLLSLNKERLHIVCLTVRSNWENLQRRSSGSLWHCFIIYGSSLISNTKLAFLHGFFLYSWWKMGFESEKKWKSQNEKCAKIKNRDCIHRSSFFCKNIIGNVLSLIVALLGPRVKTQRKELI